MVQSRPFTAPVLPATDDGDAIPDATENALAAAFLPFLHISQDEDAGFGVLGPKPTKPQLRQVVQALASNDPQIYYRVAPLGIGQGTNGPNVLAVIAFYEAWLRDTGPVIQNDFILALVLALFGSVYEFIAEALAVPIAAALLGHPFDEELVYALVSAPGTTYPSDPAQYRVIDFYTTAHENTPFDQSLYFRPPNDQPLGIPDAAGPMGRHVEVFCSLGKHGNYRRNPDGTLLAIGDIPLQATVVELLVDVLIDTVKVIEDPSLPAVEQLRLTLRVSAIVISIIYVLRVFLTDRFTPGGYDGIPRRATHIGELGHALNGATWACETKAIGGAADLRPKFRDLPWGLTSAGTPIALSQCL